MSFLKIFKSTEDDIQGGDKGEELVILIADEEDENVCLKKLQKLLKEEEKIDMNYSFFNSESQEHETSIYVAITKGWLKVADCLLKSGSKVDSASGEDEWTPLFIACEKGYVNAVKLLLDNGAQVNYQDLTGWTCLFVAANEGHKDCLSLLLDRGGNCLLENEEKKTAYEYSRNPEIKKIFEKHIESVKGKDTIIQNLENEISQLKEIINEQQKLITVLQLEGEGKKRNEEFKKEAAKNLKIRRRRSFNKFRGSVELLND